MSNQQHSFRVSFFVTAIFAIGLAAFYLLGTARSQAQQPNAAPKAAFAGTETCAMCHDDVLGEVKQSPHGVLMTVVEEKGNGHVCEGCHGPGSLHAEDPSKETAAPLIRAARQGDGCFQCHDKNKKLSRTDWLRSRHSRQDVTCMACHGQQRDAATPPGAAVAKDRDAEQPKEEKAAEPPPFSHADFTRVPPSQACFSCHADKRAEFALPSHHPVKEGRIECADCHNPHAPVTDRNKHDVCVTCHIGQRGPHIFEHGAIAGKGLTDACLSCHLPHGSPNQRMLKLSNRGLCLQCHADRATHFVGRNCVECHRAVHGSNTNSLLFQN